MPVQVSAIDKFTTIKTKRDTLSRQVAVLEGKLGSSRERYNEIMRELNKYGIGSIDELRTKIAELDGQINKGLDEAEGLLTKMEAELKTLDQNGR